MSSDQWTTYRTRFLVKAKQLSSNLSFVDHLGRQHRGRKGDYLVESCDGVITIAPRQIFEDIYVPMSLRDGGHAGLAQHPNCPRSRQPNLKSFAARPLEIERIEGPTVPVRTTGSRRMGSYDPTRARRKSPQPVLSVRPPAQLGFL